MSTRYIDNSLTFLNNLLITFLTGELLLDQVYYKAYVHCEEVAQEIGKHRFFFQLKGEIETCHYSERHVEAVCVDETCDAHYFRQPKGGDYVNTIRSRHYQAYTEVNRREYWSFLSVGESALE